MSHLLLIASGHIPPTTTLLSEYDEDGSVREWPLESIDAQLAPFSQPDNL